MVMGEGLCVALGMCKWSLCTIINWETEEG